MATRPLPTAARWLSVALALCVTAHAERATAQEHAECGEESTCKKRDAAIWKLNTKAVRALQRGDVETSASIYARVFAKATVVARRASRTRAMGTRRVMSCAEIEADRPHRAPWVCRPTP